MQKICYCGSTNFKILTSYSSFQNFNVSSRQIIQCNNCQIITRNPSIYNDSTIEDGIPSSLIEGSEFISGSVDRPNKVFIKRLEQIEKLVKVKKVLDIGAGNGAFLQIAKSLNWETSGAELNENNYNAIIKQGINCYNKDVLELNLPPESFSFIHMNHVFEHVKEPYKILMECYRLLTPGGVLIIEVPNEFKAFTSSLKRMLGMKNNSFTSYFEHEWYYDPASLKIMISKSGFRIIRFETLSRAAGSYIKRLLNKIAVLINRGPIMEVLLQK